MPYLHREDTISSLVLVQVMTNINPLTPLTNISALIASAAFHAWSYPGRRPPDATVLSPPVVPSGRYAHGPVPLQSQHYTTSQDIISSHNCVRQEMLGYEPKLSEVRLRRRAISRLMMTLWPVSKRWNLWMNPCRWLTASIPHRCCPAQRQPLPSQSCRRAAPSCSQQRSKLSIVSLRLRFIMHELQVSPAKRRGKYFVSQDHFVLLLPLQKHYDTCLLFNAVFTA